jgi:hypothetical protein
MRLDRWERRPREEANLFNPSFLCALTYEFLQDFSRGKSSGASIFLVMTAMATGLHGPTRARLPHSTVTQLYGWIQENEDLMIGFADRARNLNPYVREAVMFGLATGTIVAGEDATLVPGSSKATFSKGFLEQTTPETRTIVERTRFIGRWFAKSGSEMSIAAALGVRP